MFGIGSFHETQAYENYESDYDSGEGRQRRRREANPDYYHGRHEFKPQAETPKSYLLTILGLEVWVPKSIIRKIDREKGTCLIHTPILAKILETRHEAAKLDFELISRSKS